MKAFWWYEEQSLAGMARPGFNGTHWQDLSFEEGLVHTWFARQGEYTGNVKHMMEHVLSYGQKVMPYYTGIDNSFLNQMLKSMEDENALTKRIEHVLQKTSGVRNVKVKDGNISFEINQPRLEEEMDYLKNQNIHEIIALTENHHLTDVLSKKFKLHHLPIDDLNAPKVEQAQQMAEILSAAAQNKKGVAVHCMAGMGRTSTMIIAAQILLEKGSQDELLTKLRTQNPRALLTPIQMEFIQEVSKKR